MKILRCDRQVGFGGTRFERVALFDRDGVLNIDHGYVCEIEKFEWVEGSVEVVRACREAGWGVGVITNQSGIGRGYYAESAFLELTEWLGGEAPIDLVVYCPHAPEAGCPGRKPGVRMLEMALTYFGATADAAFFVGDKVTDIEAAEAAGMHSVRFLGGNLRESVKDLGIF